MDVSASIEARQKYRHFRILVIGRANAGKTTLLKRVCNTTDEPCIYDEKSNSLLEPTSQRGIHDINRPFAFASNPEFIFHDSPGFETGDETQLKAVQSFIKERARSTEVDNQLHAIWFCFTPDISRFILDLEKRFFNEERAGNVPIVAIFTKFDDLINQIYDPSLDEDENRSVAEKILKDDLRAPLFEFKFPPRADVCLEELHEDDGDHQMQVKELIEKTAESLDDLALKMLFVSLQQNNLELCMKYAVKYVLPRSWTMNMPVFVEGCLTWFRHTYFEFYDYGYTEHNDLIRSISGGSRGGIRIIRRRRSSRRSSSSSGGLRRQLFINSKEVATFSMTMFHKPSLTIFAAILICLENSFWHQSLSVSFIDAFHKAFAMYKETGTQNKVEIALKVLDDSCGEMAFQSALLQTLLEHRLSHPDSIQTPN